MMIKKVITLCLFCLGTLFVTAQEQEKTISVSLDVELVDGEEQRNIEVTIGEGESTKVIKWSDDGEIPEEIRAKLESEGVHIDMIDGGGGDDEMEIEVEIHEGGDKDGEQMLWTTDGDLSDETKEKLQKLGIDIENLEGDGQKQIKILIDKDGNYNSFEFEGGEIGKDMEFNLEEMGIDMDNIEGVEKRVKIMLDEDGNEKIMEWDGEGEMSEEMKELLDKHNIQINDNIELHLEDGHGTIDLDDIIRFDERGNLIKSIQISGDEPNRAQLGVAISTVDNGVLVEEVIDGSGAADAGLLKDDIILSFNDQRVKDLEDLLDQLKDKEPGDQVKLDILRGTRSLQKEVVLSESKNVSKVIKKTIKIDQKCGTNLSQDQDVEMLFKSIGKDGNSKMSKSIVIIKTDDQETEEGVDAQVVTRENPYKDFEKLDLQDFRLFPNPTEGEVTVAFQGNKTPVIVQVTDVSGKKIYSDIVNNFNGDYNKKIDLSGVSSGQYFLYIIQEQKVHTKNIIVN